MYDYCVSVSVFREKHEQNHQPKLHEIIPSSVDLGHDSYVAYLNTVCVCVVGCCTQVQC